MILRYLFVLMLLPSVAFAQMKVRIWNMPDGSKRYTSVASDFCRTGETPDSCSKRAFDDTGNSSPELKPLLQSGSYQDVDAKTYNFEPAREKARAEAALIRARKQSAITKLKALGLTDEELNALGIR